MKGLEFRKLPNNEVDAANALMGALDEVINMEKFVVFENVLPRYDKSWLFNIFEKSRIVESETTQVDVNSLKKFDQTWWEIRYDPQNDNVYKHSKTRQPLHTDNAFLNKPPKISLFAMERQVSSGGESTLLPLSELISILETEAPTLLEKLSNNVFTISKGDEIEPHLTPIINLKTKEINWNYYRTDKSSPEQASIVEEFYDFLEKLESDERIYVRKFKSGDVYLFNDLKYLHARKAFDAGAVGDRLLCHSMWNVV